MERRIVLNESLKLNSMEWIPWEDIFFRGIPVFL